MTQVRQPRERREKLNGLVHRICQWGPEDGAPVILLHGWLDTCRSWDLVASRLSASLPDRPVVSFDWRGHGDSAWAPEGSYYHFFDYVADLAALVRSLGGGRVDLVGHSMGGNAAAYFTGAFPEKVDRLALLESVIMPDASNETLPSRMRAWIEAVQAGPPGAGKLMADLPAVAARLRITMPRVPSDVALYLAAHAARPAPGGWVWRFDPLHRTPGPLPFQVERSAPFWRSIGGRVLVMEGEETQMPISDLHERYAHFSHVEREVIPGAGHALHVEAPDAVARRLAWFLATP